MVEERIKEIREKAANLLAHDCIGCILPETSTCVHPCPQQFFYTDKILSLFPDWAKKQGYVKIALDQSLPENPYPPDVFQDGIGKFGHSVFENAVCDMRTPHDNGDGTETVWMKVVRCKK